MNHNSFENVHYELGTNLKRSLINGLVAEFATSIAILLTIVAALVWGCVSAAKTNTGYVNEMTVWWVSCCLIAAKTVLHTSSFVGFKRYYSLKPQSLNGEIDVGQIKTLVVQNVAQYSVSIGICISIFAENQVSSGVLIVVAELLIGWMIVKEFLGAFSWLGMHGNEPGWRIAFPGALLFLGALLISFVTNQITSGVFLVALISTLVIGSQFKKTTLANFKNSLHTFANMGWKLIPEDDNPEDDE